MAKWAWVYDPHSGGNKIPQREQEAICQEAEAFARSRTWYSRVKLKLRFRSQFCYVDTIEEGDGRAFPWCRMRYFARDRWSVAVFLYSNESYERHVFLDGQQQGEFKSALEACEGFIVMNEV